ncbi:MAG: hypothetical protein HY875_17185 [Chloroflexi bacterium]|nr:hypothetical protein [Chloroflexota bacterium]
MTLIRGTLISFTAATYLSVVRLDGSQPRTLTNVRSSRFASAEYVANRRVIVDTGDNNNPDDYVITALYT